MKRVSSPPLSPSMLSIKHPNLNHHQVLRTPSASNSDVSDVEESEHPNEDQSQGLGQSEGVAPFKAAWKVVVRHLPPTLPSATFWETVAEWLPETTYTHYVPGHLPRKSRTKPITLGRAYLTFPTESLVRAFHATFHGHVFVDSKGTKFPATVSLALNPLVPNQLIAKQRHQAWINTLQKDKLFLAFLASSATSAKASSTVKDTGNESKQGVADENQVDASTTSSSTPLLASSTHSTASPFISTSPTTNTTPLLEYLKQKSEAKVKSKQKSKSKSKTKSNSSSSLTSSPISTSSLSNASKKPPSPGISSSSASSSSAINSRGRHPTPSTPTTPDPYLPITNEKKKQTSSIEGKYLIPPTTTSVSTKRGPPPLLTAPTLFPPPPPFPSAPSRSSLRSSTRRSRRSHPLVYPAPDPVFTFPPCPPGTDQAWINTSDDAATDVRFRVGSGTTPTRRGAKEGPPSPRPPPGSARPWREGRAVAAAGGGGVSSLGSHGRRKRRDRGGGGRDPGARTHPGGETTERVPSAAAFRSKFVEDLSMYM